LLLCKNQKDYNARINHITKLIKLIKCGGINYKGGGGGGITLVEGKKEYLYM